MHQLITLILSFNLAFSAQVSTPDPLINHQLANVALDYLFAELRPVKTLGDARRLLLPLLRGEARSTMEVQLKRLKTFPKIIRLNRGFAYDVEGKHYTFATDDILSNRYTVNGKTQWSYHARSPLSVQLEVLSRGLEKANVGWLRLFSNEAHADGGASIIIGILIAGVLVPILADATNTYIIPKVKEWRCPNLDPNKFSDYKFCEDYFKHQAAMRPKVPDRKEVVDQHPVQILKMEKKCSTNTEPDFWIEFEGEEGKRVRRTIIYDKANKPKQMIEEAVRPRTSEKIEYALNGEGQLLSVNTGATYFSRDPKDKEQMTPEKLKQMEVFDQALNSTIGFVKLCDPPPELAQAASAPSTLVATEVLKPNEPGHFRVDDSSRAVPTSR